jgi:hypothetical protein
MTGLLPGGLSEPDGLHREFAFAPVTGELELILGMFDGRRLGVVDRVTSVLCAALEHIGGRPVTSERVLDLCVDDRRFLMQQLAGELGIATVWVTSACPACAAIFDCPVHPTRLPVKPAGPDYPFASVITSIGPLRLRVPTGVDQQALSSLGSRSLTRDLIARCVVDGPGEAVSGTALAGALTDADVERIGAALEESSPEVARRATGNCPTCGETIDIEVDPYLCLYLGAERLLDEVEALAATYHWSEQDILALPRERRRRYLRSSRRMAFAG